ncbi:MAG: hypothetical protein V7719_15635 [Psychroserpens sp.]|uniref:hypothetical protein n=1 Tax=Psychroserpens sp. TaxID=2020870 RepID=UPI003002E7A6
MKVFLNQIEVNKELFIVNDGLNYGRLFDKKIKEYQIQLTNFEIIELIEKEYCEVRDEIKVDDQINKDTSDFTKTNYCSLSQLLSHESDFEEIMKTYLDITLFKKVFIESSKKTYVINSTDSIQIKNDMVIFRGRIFELTK